MRQVLVYARLHGCGIVSPLLKISIELSVCAFAAALFRKKLPPLSLSHLKMSTHSTKMDCIHDGCI
jgi:hypothetical protein